MYKGNRQFHTKENIHICWYSKKMHIKAAIGAILKILANATDIMTKTRRTKIQ